MDIFVVEHNLRAPWPPNVSQDFDYAFRAITGVDWLAPVPPILRYGRQAEVRINVIQAVAVDVVDFHASGRIENGAV